ncbi:hypothetical protein LTR66_015222, partial [Elasticomyces elasticus]
MPPLESDAPWISSDDEDYTPISGQVQRPIKQSVKTVQASDSTVTNLQAESSDEDVVLRRSLRKPTSKAVERAFIRECPLYENADWKRAELHNLKVYSYNSDHKQLESLHYITCGDKEEPGRYLLEGTIVFEKDGMVTTQVIEDVPITNVQLDNLPEPEQGIPVTCSTIITIQTREAERLNCYYEINHPPHEEYAGIFDNFIWLANLAKHVYDYLQWSATNGRSVGLQNFRLDFIKQIRQWHMGKLDFIRWNQPVVGLIDFRHHITSAAYATFLYGHAYNLLDNSALMNHPLWTELGFHIDDYGSIKASDQTLVDRRISQCFEESFPSWGRRGHNILRVVDVDSEVQQRRETRRLQLGLRPTELNHTTFEIHGRKKHGKAALALEAASTARTYQCFANAEEIIHKLVVVKPFQNSDRLPQASTDYRFAYVHSLTSIRRVNVRWLSLPARTICNGRGRAISTRFDTFYPNGNELFYTNECSCRPIDIKHIVAVHEFPIGQTTSAQYQGFFATRMYQRNTSSIIEDIGTSSSHCAIHSQRATRLGTVRDNISASTQFKNLSIFSGAGILDKALEVGSSGKMKTVFSADLNPSAHLSCKANSGGDHKIHFADVNDLCGKLASGVLLVGEIDTLTAGCPCQGFSRLNSNAKNRESVQNCTLLAHAVLSVHTPAKD